MDWWFPNIGTSYTAIIGCWRMGNPFARWARGKIRKLQKFEVETTAYNENYDVGTTKNPTYGLPSEWFRPGRQVGMV